MERLRITIIGCLLAVVLCNASGCKNKSETQSKSSTPIVAETTEIPATPPAVATEPIITEEKFKNQREAVKEERRLRVDNQPYTKVIFEEGYKIFGELPYDDYLIIVNTRGGGGLEHLNSTALQWNRFGFKPPARCARSAGTHPPTDPRFRPGGRAGHCARGTAHGR